MILRTRRRSAQRTWTQQAAVRARVDSPGWISCALALSSSRRRTSSVATALATAASAEATSSFAFSSARAEIACWREFSARRRSLRANSSCDFSSLTCACARSTAACAACTAASFTRCVRTSRKVGVGRLDDGDDGLAGNHLVADVALRPQHLAADRRGDGVDVADAGDALVLDGDFERACVRWPRCRPAPAAATAPRRSGERLPIRQHGDDAPTALPNTSYSRVLRTSIMSRRSMRRRTTSAETSADASTISSPSHRPTARPPAARDRARCRSPAPWPGKAIADHPAERLRQQREHRQLAEQDRRHLALVEAENPQARKLAALLGQRDAREIVDDAEGNDHAERRHRPRS